MLKSRSEFCPGGFQFVQPETGWQAPQGSFGVVVKAIRNHRLANKALAEKHAWAMTTEAIGDELDLFNTKRCIKHGWWNFINDPEGTVVPKAPASQPQQKSAAAGGVKQIVAGVKTLLDWLGGGGHPVDKSLAETRASVCAGCPQNGQGNWMSYFTRMASEEIRRQLEIRESLSLSTSSDERLGVCVACACPLKLKVWAPLSHVLAHLDPETKKNLDKRCWIVKSEP